MLVNYKMENFDGSCSSDDCGCEKWCFVIFLGGDKQTIRWFVLGSVADVLLNNFIQ